MRLHHFTVTRQVSARASVAGPGSRLSMAERGYGTKNRAPTLSVITSRGYDSDFRAIPAPLALAIRKEKGRFYQW